MKPRSIVLLVVPLALLVLGGIGYGGYSFYTFMAKEMALVEEVSRLWIKQYNAGNFPALYQMTDPTRLGIATEAEFIAKISKLKEDIGELQLGGQNGFKIKTANGETTAVCHFHATDARGKQEVTFYLYYDSQWRVTRFRVD